jgi:hypothetical protein
MSATGPQVNALHECAVAINRLRETLTAHPKLFAEVNRMHAVLLKVNKALRGES